ncbi:MAG: hypothetical protein G8345_11325 [Magnetococcales bacterium]|nr:hypothetical protein [Magnetococcales bacterium]
MPTGEINQADIVIAATNETVILEVASHASCPEKKKKRNSHTTKTKIIGRQKEACLYTHRLPSELIKNLVDQSVGDRLINSLTKLIPGLSKSLVGFKRKSLLDLSWAATMNMEQAAMIARHRVFYLNLSGLTTLTPDLAKEIAKCRGSILDLSGLTALDEETAGELVRCKTVFLNLSGLTTLTANVATKLASVMGILDLSGLSTMDVETASELASGWASCLNLSGLKRLEPTSVLAFTKWNDMHIDLSGLNEISVETVHSEDRTRSIG